MNKNTKKAFTLVELIVVITILAILGTIAFISMQGYSKSSRDSFRLSDVSNMEMALALFHLDAGKYPLPDDYEIVEYEGEILWYQGFFGENTVSQLSRNLNNIPKDPSTDEMYLFSVANNRNEFEILTLLEGELVINNIINKTNAVNHEPITRIDGNYNGVFLKTPTHIVPVPSVINSEVYSGSLILDASNIKSQIVSGGDNIPNHGNIYHKTGALLGLNLSVYTGSIYSNSDDIDKENAMKRIQNAYSGSEFSGDEKIKYILNKSSTEELVALANTIILKNTSVVENNGGTSSFNNSISACGTTIGEIFYSTSDGTDTGLTCTDDIIVCNGTTGSGITIASCNVGSNISGTGASSYGHYFQFGRDISYENGGRTTGSSTDYYDWISPGGEDNGSANNWGLEEFEKYTATYVNQDSIDQIKMQGPCNTGYHLPTILDWQNLVNLKWDYLDANLGINIINDLKIPLAGRLHWNGSGLVYDGTYGRYWSSSPSLQNSLNLRIENDDINSNEASSRTNGFSIRCFKN